MHANHTAKGTKNYWTYCLTFCLHQHSSCQSSVLLSQRIAAGSGRGCFATPRHGVSCLLCLMKAILLYLHRGMSYASTLNPPIDCTANHLSKSPRQNFRLPQIYWTPAYLADFPRGAWTWNNQLSPIQYVTFQFPQLLSAFGNDVAVDRTDSASLFYRQTYPGAG